MGKLRDMYNLQKQAREIKNKLKAIHIEAEQKGVMVTVSADQKIVKIEIQDDTLLQNKEKLISCLKDALDRALEKAQKIAAAEMKGIMGEMGMGV
ncbi:hypothetical protein AUJ78_00325 [Candidatus Peregrinibacteria bacterium CG1_02_41_10]|nr:MAG: hypothetical protein AUJ78_00325 [Candidatus Peregrinibacteria bacterium CG1_02_41_10]